MKLFKLQNRARRHFDLETIDPAQLPILDAATLAQALGQTNRLRGLRRLVGVGAKQYEALYQAALERFMEAAQLQPASAVDHHAAWGGLIVHTLDVIERALRYRKQYLLPQNAGPERISEEEHAWTYGVFAAALLHDAGKLLTLTRLRLDGQHPWTPQGPPLRDMDADFYTIEFVNAPYALQSRSNGSLFHLLPALGRDLLAQNTELLSQLLAWLSADPYEWGPIGEIVRRADGESVAENRKAGGERERLPNAQAAPLVERMMRALRQLIYDGELKFNRSGGAGWVEGACTYLVCAVAANAVAGRLRQEGSVDVPSDNSRLFDIWQDHGYVIPTESGRAIWNIRVVGADYRHGLSMLKFETHRLFHPSRRPAVFDGELLQREGPERLDEPEPGAESVPDETDDGAMAQAAEPVAPETGPAPEKQALPEGSEATKRQGATTLETRKEPVKIIQPPASLDDPEIGAHFFSWVRAGIRDKGLKVNRKEAMVHTVPEGILLVTPAIFKAYMEHYGLASRDEDELDKNFRRVQARIQKLRRHRRTTKGLNIFKYKIEGPKFSSYIQGWLFAPSVIYGDEPPPAPNKVLSIQSELNPDT